MLRLSVVMQIYTKDRREHHALAGAVCLTHNMVGSERIWWRIILRTHEPNVPSQADLDVGEPMDRFSPKESFAINQESSWRSALASRRSGVSNPSVNHSFKGVKSSRASAHLDWLFHRRARATLARSSYDLACWRRATSTA